MVNSLEKAYRKNFIINAFANVFCKSYFITYKGYTLIIRPCVRIIERIIDVCMMFLRVISHFFLYTHSCEGFAKTNIMCRKRTWRIIMTEVMKV